MSKLIAVGMQSKYSWVHDDTVGSVTVCITAGALSCYRDLALGWRPCAYVATLTRLWLALALADIGHRSLVIILSLSRTITPSQSLSQLSSLRQTKDIKDKWYFWVFKIFRIYGGFKTLWCQTYRGPPWPMSPWSVPHRSLVTSTIADVGPGLGSVPQLSHRIVIFLYNFPHTSLPSLICNFINGL